MRKVITLMIALLSLTFNSFSQESFIDTNQDYWTITNRKSIVWDLTKTAALPHKENIEMAGKNVASIIYYDIDTNKNVSITRDVIFPQLRTFNKTNEPDWKKYRAYFRRSISETIQPIISHDKKTIVPAVVDSIEINGMITFYYHSVNGLKITKTLYPSMENRFLVEKWSVENINPNEVKIDIANCQLKQIEIGYKGSYTFQVFSNAKSSIKLKSKAVYEFPVYYGATMNEEKSTNFDYKVALMQRQQFIKKMANQLVIRTPNKILNQLFYFSKIRASESIYNSSMGLIHSPGGGNYYLGTWANDQVEYSGPFFPYLGYETGNIAAYNTYKMFLKNIPKDGSHIPYAFEMDGNFPMKHLDRGDAAMIAYGTAHYALANGDKAVAKELWELIEWSLEYCHNNRNKAGVVVSESDEMEGRIETGTANLSSSTLYYGGLKYSIRLAEVLGYSQKVKMYKKRMKAMKKVINTYFAATMEGHETYKYFEENQYLRHWICLPLSMGIEDKKTGTIDALFQTLWTENGILVEYQLDAKVEETMFWDRATLYALQGAMKVGAVDLATEKLVSFSRKRLLGNHVPYVIEAYPENNMKHLSAESALYCRIFTEGLLGLEVIDFNRIQLKPNLPNDWDFLELHDLRIANLRTSINIERNGELLDLTVIVGERIVYAKSIKAGTELIINLR